MLNEQFHKAQDFRRLTPRLHERTFLVDAQEDAENLLVRHSAHCKGARTGRGFRTSTGQAWIPVSLVLAPKKELGTGPSCRSEVERSESSRQPPFRSSPLSALRNQLGRGPRRPRPRFGDDEMSLLILQCQQNRARQCRARQTLFQTLQRPPEEEISLCTSGVTWSPGCQVTKVEPHGLLQTYLSPTDKGVLRLRSVTGSEPSSRTFSRLQ